jgi:hypothetical protein
MTNMKDELRKYLKQLGAKGGRTTLKKYGKRTMTEWGKRGGRPRKNKGEK